ncbi:MAG: DUF4180 domain-containing protein [Bryobacteraceae bacterium]
MTAMRDAGRAPSDLVVIEDGGFRFVEGPPDRAFMHTVDDADRVLEACFSAGVALVLLYAPNLTPGFFDLSSGDAGAVLQKLRTYRIRLAVVCPEGSVRFSSRFSEMGAEERRGDHFGLFSSGDAAREWLKLGWGTG